MLGLLVATLALHAGFWSGLVLPREAGAGAFGMAVMVALMLAWLLWPAPLGGGARLAALLVPQPAGSILAALAVAAIWFLIARVGAELAVGMAFGFDLDASGYRPATTGEIIGLALAGGLLALLHGLFCLGWVLGDAMHRDDAFAGAWQAALVAVALPVACFAPIGFGLLGVLIGLFITGPATVATIVVVLVGGRVWLAILAGALAWALALPGLEVPFHDR